MASLYRKPKDLERPSPRGFKVAKRQAIVHAMGGAPVTLEGWFVLHEMYALDWTRWNALEAPARDAAVREATTLLETRPSEGHSACFSLLTQKGDLCFLHWRQDVDALRREEVALQQTRLAAFLRPTYSYLSVIELGTYELGEHASAMVERRGTARGSAGFDEAVRTEMERLARPRLYPEVPPRRYMSFYPMSKRRGEQVNWFDLGAAERAEMMRGHGTIGRKYAGQVTQVISGSVGLDDWEWGVTLFADDPLVFKKLVYEMRFDPASSRYALFGPFFTGIRFPPAALGEVLRRGVAGAS
jgi:hydrogen peroxide-dependent heme synthase